MQNGLPWAENVLLLVYTLWYHMQIMSYYLMNSETSPCHLHSLAHLHPHSTSLVFDHKTGNCAVITQINSFTKVKLCGHFASERNTAVWYRNTHTLYLRVDDVCIEVEVKSMANPTERQIVLFWKSSPLTTKSIWGEEEKSLPPFSLYWIRKFINNLLFCLCNCDIAKLRSRKFSLKNIPTDTGIKPHLVWQATSGASITYHNGKVCERNEAT